MFFRCTLFREWLVLCSCHGWTCYNHATIHFYNLDNLSICFLIYVMWILYYLKTTKAIDKPNFCRWWCIILSIITTKIHISIDLTINCHCFVYYNFTISEIWCINIRGGRGQNWIEGNSYFIPRVCKVPCCFRSCKSSLIQLLTKRWHVVHEVIATFHHVV
jgi:hypothetical protein